MKKSVLIIKGHSKDDIELDNDRKIIQLYKDFFHSNAGGCFEDDEIFILEDVQVEDIRKMSFLNERDYLIIVLIGHGANQNDTQVFQLSEKVLIYPGQIQFECKKQLFIIETCRNIIRKELDIFEINDLRPKYKYGGTVQHPLTKEEALQRFNNTILNSTDGITYIFACDIDQSAYNYYFLKLLIRYSIYLHEHHRNRVYSVNEIFQIVKSEIEIMTYGKQSPMITGKGDFPFVITII